MFKCTIYLGKINYQYGMAIVLVQVGNNISNYYKYYTSVKQCVCL